MGENHSKRILLVDDSRAVRQLLRLILDRKLSLEISEAGDGVEAVGKMRDQEFDLVITDINMPNMDGLQLISEVRQNITTDVPIIIVSTKGKEADRDKGLQLGANSYITKPVNAPDLIKAVSSLIN